VSQADIDYAKFIVYFAKGHPASDDLLKMCAPFTSEFILQDVTALPKPYPEWLRGVPTVVTHPGYAVHQGTQALDLVGEWCESQVNGIQGGNVGTPKIQSAQLGQYSLAAASRGTLSLQADARYSDEGKTAQRGGGRLSSSTTAAAEDLGGGRQPPSTLEEALRLRALPLGSGGQA